ncbi:MAG TPA: hypothetical protein VIZ86_16590 [Pseudomonas sp.]
MKTPINMTRGARGYRINNMVSPVEVTRSGEKAPLAYCASVQEALALVEADKAAAAHVGPPLRCPGCQPGACDCLP